MLLHIRNIISNNKLVTFCFIYIIVTIVGYNFQFGIKNTILSLFIFSFFLSLVFIFGLIAAPVYIIFSVISSSEIIFNYFFNERVSIGLIGSVMESNSSESASMISEYAKYIPSYIANIIVYSTPAFMIKRNIRIGAILFLPSFFVFNSIYKKINKIPNNYKNEVYFFKSNVATPLHKTYPFFIGDAVYIASMIIEDNAIYIKKDHKFPIGKVNEKTRDIKEDVIVFIMGETSLSDRYSLYGYKIKTTPFMDRLKEMDIISCYFNNVHSSANLTRYSVPMSFSFDVPERQDYIFNEMNIIELANRAGLRTHWITAQSNRDGLNTKINFIASYASEIVTPDNLRNDEKINMDIDLIPYLKDAIDKEGKHFIVLHMNGSHQKYSNKYDEIDSKSLPSASDYDRSIHHTDRVVNAVFESLESSGKKYSVLFTSDHGEVVGKGHGYVSDGGRQLFVPLVYFSNSSDKCSNIEKLRGNNGWISGLSNKFMVLDMIGYDINPDFIDSEIHNDRIFRSNAEVADFLDELKS
ncbi:phosphoethanolamine transferase [Morganella morganii]|uniref:phosphoethanolamine transferase n=1 Tax=Morganella morganii TaxID=582 RepID=UPI0034D68973